MGDVSGAKATLTNAQRIAELIENAYEKDEAQQELAATQTKAPVAVSDWIEILDTDDKNDTYPYSKVVPLNSELFLDLRGYLKSLPPSNNPQKIFNDLIAAVNKIIAAQNDIHRMLKQPAIR